MTSADRPMWIANEYVEAQSGGWIDSEDPATQEIVGRVPAGEAADVDRAVAAANAAADGWRYTAANDRAELMHEAVAKSFEHLDGLIDLLTREQGKAKPEQEEEAEWALTSLRYYAELGRNGSGRVIPSGEPRTQLNLVLKEPYGVVGAIVPWNYPMLLLSWKLAPALAAGNAVVLKPAEQTPASIMKVMELIGDLLPDGVVNVVNGFGLEAGKPLASSPRIAKIAFTGETTTGRLIMQYASQNIIPVTLELGGKSPNVFFADVMAEDDNFLDKALEGFVMFALNQGEVCTCPSRALIAESIYDEFLEKAIARTEAIVTGDPLDDATMLGAQASNDQLEKILSYIDIGKAEGAKVLTGGSRRSVDGYDDGYYVDATVLEGTNDMRVFQEEIFGPVVAVTPFRDEDHAIEIANDTLYGLGAGVWTRDKGTAYRAGRQIQAGRVWTNCYHAYPAHAAFGGYKGSGIGRENHKAMLGHYQQTKNLLVSYDPNPMGFF